MPRPPPRAATQTDMNTMAATTPARAMSLEDCIQEALAAQPRRANLSATTRKSQLFNVRATTAVTIRPSIFPAQHQYNDTGPDFQNAMHIAGTSYERKQFQFGLSNGTMPWGMTYNLSGNVSHTYDYNLDSPIFTNSDNSGGQVGVS